MKSSYLKILILASLLFCVKYSFAQITIESKFYNTGIEVFFINDFDLTQSGSGPLLFEVTITNEASVIKRISLALSIRYTGFESGETELASGETAFFDLSPGKLLINNLNLFSQADQYKLNDYNINEDAADELINTILTTGKLPSGKYEFFVSITEENTGSTYDDPEPIEIIITNPTTLDLISPGEPAGSSELMEIYTLLPQFHWESDASGFWLKVFDASNSSSPEDVLSNDPLLAVYIPKEENINTTSFLYLYPSSGVSNLVEGKTYYWQVAAVTQSSSGPIELQSEIWGFKIANMSGGPSSALQMQIVNLLKLLLPEDEVDNLFNENGELVNFSSTGVILKNGTTISLEELQALVDKAMTGTIIINGYSVE